jgi:UDP-N-acetylmuramoyl-tripeptide--D-alanyl-D-alanine ligase
MKLTLFEIQRLLGARVRGIKGDLEFFGFVTDSREAFPGSLFVALRGERRDGKKFSQDALAKGALAVLVDREVSPNIPQIVCEDTKKALFKLAHYAREKLMDVEVVAVTGSVGKTTTKGMIARVLSKKFRVYESPRSYNSSIGVPLTLLNAPTDIDILVAEVGAQKPGELMPLVSLLSPKVGVITKIAKTHLQYFGDVMSVAKEKRVLLESLPEGGVAVLNQGTPALSVLLDGIPRGVRLLTFGIGTGDISAREVKSDLDGSSFKIRDISFRLPYPGKGFVENALAAVSVGSLFGITLPDAANTLRNFEALPGRMERIRVGSYEVINDSYNSNPDSLGELFRAISERDGRRTIFIVGDMLELGQEGPRLHREMGTLFAELGHRHLITVGKLAKEGAKEAKRGGVREVYSFDKIEDLSHFLREYLGPGDLLVLKASRAVQLERVLEYLKKL